MDSVLSQLILGFEKRIKNAHILNNGINKITGLTAPKVEKGVKHVFHQYVMRVEDNYCKSRDDLADCLLENGIGVGIHYPIPIYRQPLYQNLGYNKTKCPNTEETCKRVLSLPVHPLVNEKDKEYILDTLQEIS